MNWKKLLFFLRKNLNSRPEFLMINLATLPLNGIRFLLIFIFIVSCGTLDLFNQSQQELDLKIKAFNIDFENKAFDRAARFVHPDFREDFQKKSLEVAKRTTILEYTTLGIKFFKDGQPVRPTSSNPLKDFNKTEVTIRYQISVLPSTKLKFIIVKQEWVKWNTAWVVIPKIDSFLN